jgi:antitoxin YefM
MIAVKSMDVRDNFKSFCEMVFKGEVLVISRPKNENIVMLSEKEYNDIMKAKRNAEYLAKIEESYEQLKQGKTISFTLEELKDMESDDWKPTQKVVDFMEKMKNE